MILILWIAFVAGVIFLIKERGDRRENERRFAEWLHRYKDATLAERREAVHQLYFHNGYTVVEIDDRTLEVSRRHFSFGWALITFSFLAVGLLLYLLWHYWFQNPEVIRIRLDDERFGLLS